MFLKANTPKDILIHIAIILAIFTGLVLMFFYVYLPLTTHHGETITVPKIVGMNSQELENFLASKNLRYKINDSTYTPGVKPNTVLTQHPIEGSQVKQNRMIYISIASATPPKVKMPKLVDGSLKSAEMMLRSYDLVLGKVTSVPSPYANLVMDQQVNGKPITPGSYVPKGTKVDLVVGNGSGAEDVEVPDVTGMTVEEAKLALSSAGLSLGIELADNSSDATKGTITKQKPSAGAGAKIRVGSDIDVWVAGAEAAPNP